MPHRSNENKERKRQGKPLAALFDKPISAEVERYLLKKI